MQVKTTIVVIFIFVFTFQSFAQTDTEFWFAAPNVTSGHDGNRLEFNMRFSSFGLPSEVTISMPANPDFDPIVINLDANDTKTVEIYEDDFMDQVRNYPPMEVLNRGVLIEATNYITAYYEISTPDNPDIYSLKGDNALGNEFYVPFQNYYRNGPAYTPRPYSSIDIVATRDNTEITVTPTNPVWQKGNEEFTIVLNRGESYAVVPDDYQGAGQQPGNRLGGTKIESNRPIVIITSDDSVDAYPHAGCKDVIGDQIIPVDLIGTEYIAMKGRLNIPEHFYIIGTQDGTDIYIDNEFEATIDESETYRYEFIEQKPYYISTSNPTYVYHVAGFGCEMGGAILPPINVCTGSTEVSFTRSKGESFFLNILVRVGAQDGFILNGDENLINADDFEPVLGNDQWMVGEFEFGQGVIPVGEPSHIQNTEDVFHLGIINGAGSTGVLYGYFSDFQELEIDAFEGGTGSSQMIGCHGESFRLVATGGIDYSWTPTDYLDDPTSSTPLATPPHDMEYWTTVSGACDMIDSTSVSIFLFDPVISLFTVDKATGCSPFEVEITDHSIGVSVYSWRFGDGKTSGTDSTNFSHTYINDLNEPEFFELELVGRMGRCRDTMSTNIVVFPGIEAKIDNEDISGCAPLSINFEDASSGASNYLWNFGDGNSTTDINPTHTFHNYGDTDTTYTVVLLAMSEYGCVDYDTMEVHVKPYVGAGFEFDPPSHCNPYLIEISNTTVGATSHIWDFDDGTDPVEINQDSINYTLENFGSEPETFNIKLFAENNYGCYDTLAREAVVYPYLEAAFEPSDLEGCNPMEVNFSNLSEGAESYYWDFDKDEGSSSKEEPVHVFHNPDPEEIAVFDVVLTVFSEYGCEDTTSAKITVYPRLEASFTFEQSSYCSPFDVVIYNNSVGADSVHWDFGDGNSYYESSDEFIHTFENPTDEPVTYTITQTVKNDHDCQDIKTKEVTIYPEIEADFDIGFDDPEGCHPLVVSFENKSIGASYYHWDFGDGGTSSQVELTRVFNNPSNTEPKQYDIKLFVESDYGCTDSTSKTIVVNPKPKAVLELSENQGCSPFTVDFYDQSEGGGSYKWIFGDGGDPTITGPGDAEYTYHNPGDSPDEWQPKLIISNDYGCSDTTVNNVVVFPDIEADFSVSETSGCHQLEVILTNNSSGATASSPYIWDYGDGNTSTNENPEHSHTFNNFDHENNEYFKIWLLAKSEYGCKDSVSADITVHPVPKAKYEVDEHTGCSPHDVEFNDLSVGGNESYLWKFGDGHESNEEGSVSHSYEQPADEGIGTFTSELIVTNIYGCEDQFEKNITVYPHIEADFTADMEGCHPLTVSFEDLSKGADFYHWDFGDGNHSSKAEPENIFFNTSYDELKDYDVELSVSSQYGCEAFASDVVTVHPKPKVDFTVDITDGCSPLEVLFENLSVGVDYYEWDFGNGTSVTSEPQFERIFKNTGDKPYTYNVSLTGSNEWGCYGESLKDITVYPEVTADFTTKTGYYEGCTPLELDFVNQSELADVFKWTFGDEAASSKENPSHIFYNEGNEDLFIDVTLLAKSGYSCKDSITKEITVYPQPIADFKAVPHEQTYPSTTVEVYNYSSAGDYYYDWDMGDGTSFTTDDKEMFEHTYQWESGQYATRDYYIDLYVSNAHCYDNIEQKVTIKAPAPIVGFSPSKEGCPPLQVQFKNEAKYGFYFHWDFDDGNYSDKENPVHIFEDPGVYEVTLKVTGEGGVDSAKQVITVFEPPIADFRVEPQVVELPFEPVQMINLSSLGSTYEWDFGDGTISWDYEPEHYYKNPGSYDITLTVGSDTEPQCFDEITKSSAVTAEESCKIIFPNAFKPKKSGPTGGNYSVGDPSNHIFHPVFDGIESYTLEIFNRWGELIFRSTDIMIGWDGYHNDRLVKMDVYVYKVNATCYNGKQIEKTGDVTVIR